jgi:hypothetical protein
MNEIEYDVYCNNKWCAGANDLDQALIYAEKYRADGYTEVYKVEKKVTLVTLMSMLGKEQEK